MGLRIKNFNIMESSLKNSISTGGGRGGGGFRQTSIYGGYCLHRGRAWTVSRFKEGGLGKKEGDGVFEGWGVDTLMHTMPGICCQYAP